MAVCAGQPDADSGLFSTTVYLALDVRYAYALGVLTGLMNIIPVLGAAICIGLAAAGGGDRFVGRVLGICGLLSCLPAGGELLSHSAIMKKSVDLPGLAILVALLMGSALAGVVARLFPCRRRCWWRCCWMSIWCGKSCG